MNFSRKNAFIFQLGMMVLALSGCLKTESKDGVPVKFELSGFVINVDEDGSYSGSLRQFGPTAPDLSNVTYVITTSPAKGKILNLNPETGDFVYQPEKDKNGNDSFVFEARVRGKQPKAQTAAIVVRPVNDPPTITLLPLSTLEDAVREHQAVVSDVDGDALTVSVSTAPTKGTLTVLNATTGLLRYSPDQDKNGTDSAVIRVSDGTVDASASLSISIQALPDAPKAVASNQSVFHRSDFNITLQGTDADNDAITEYQFVTMPTKGTVSSISSGGVFTYTPSVYAEGEDNFSFRVTDATGMVSTAAAIKVTLKQALHGTWKFTSTTVKLSPTGSTSPCDTPTISINHTAAVLEIPAYTLTCDIGGVSTPFNRPAQNFEIDVPTGGFGDIQLNPPGGAGMLFGSVQVLNQGRVEISGSEFPYQINRVFADTFQPAVATTIPFTEILQDFGMGGEYYEFAATLQRQ